MSNEKWTGPTKAAEGMHPDLEWLARNVSEWGGAMIRDLIFFNPSTMDVDYCSVEYYRIEEVNVFTQTEWLQARKDLGLVKPCLYPDCTCPIDNPVTCTKALDKVERDLNEAQAGAELSKPPRYLATDGRDWIDEFASVSTEEEFRGAMRFTIGKYVRRVGKKDDIQQELDKIIDYCQRWKEYERDQN